MELESLAEHAKHDREAFASLYRALYSSTYNYIRYRCDDRETAEDLTSKVFERLMVRLPTYDQIKGPFKPWFYTLTRNMVTDHFRAQKMRFRALREMAGSLLMDPQSSDTSRYRNESEEDLLAAFRQLKPKERDVLGLKFALDFCRAEIAALTGLSESNVGVIVFRALQKLREIMERSSEQWQEEAKDKQEAADHG
jgi:RNA polymerase sigma-70 factor (ECF subfamily)